MMEFVKLSYNNFLIYALAQIATIALFQWNYTQRIEIGADLIAVQQNLNICLGDWCTFPIKTGKMSTIRAIAWHAQWFLSIHGE